MKDPTFKQKEKVKKKLDPIIKIIVKYSIIFTKSMDIFKPISMNICKPIHADNITFKTCTEHFLLHIDDANNIHKCNFFHVWARY